MLGVLGGIASGKSTAARLLAGDDGVVLDADGQVAELYRDPSFHDFVRGRFGEAIVEGGVVDRAALAQQVFDDPKKRKLLEAWLHPRVRDRIRDRYDRARDEGVRTVVLDVPLLLENNDQHGLADLCDVLVFVDTPQKVRDARASEVRGWAPGEVARREAAQLPIETKRRKADYTLANDGDPEHLKALAGELLRQLEERFATAEPEGPGDTKRHES